MDRLSYLLGICRGSSVSFQSRAESKGQCLNQLHKESWDRVLRTAAGVHLELWIRSRYLSLYSDSVLLNGAKCKNEVDLPSFDCHIFRPLGLMSTSSGYLFNVTQTQLLKSAITL